MITIVNYGVGNPRAIVNMLDFIGFDAQISDDPLNIRDASHLVLPGVGAFDAAMRRLASSKLVPSLEHAVFSRKVPLLGVCLGMQLLGRRSEEGTLDGLGWIAAETVRMQPSRLKGLKVPFMGWADVQPASNTRLFDSEAESRFYFTHGYRMCCDDQADVAGTYEFEDAVVCAIEHQNIFGVQFHPEKSHKFGMKLLRNFIERAS